jgi:hypothetical protein
MSDPMTCRGNCVLLPRQARSGKNHRFDMSDYAPCNELIYLLHSIGKSKPGGFDDTNTITNVHVSL